VLCCILLSRMNHYCSFIYKGLDELRRRCVVAERNLRPSNLKGLVSFLPITGATAQVCCLDRATMIHWFTMLFWYCSKTPPPEAPVPWIGLMGNDPISLVNAHALFILRGAFHKKPRLQGSLNYRYLSYACNDFVPFRSGRLQLRFFYY